MFASDGISKFKRNQWNILYIIFQMIFFKNEEQNHFFLKCKNSRRQQLLYLNTESKLPSQKNGTYFTEAFLADLDATPGFRRQSLTRKHLVKFRRQHECRVEQQHKRTCVCVCVCVFSVFFFSLLSSKYEKKACKSSIAAEADECS